MNIVKLSSAPKVDVPGNLFVKKLWEGCGVRVAYMKIKKGEELAPHSSSKTVLLFIEEGRAEISVGDERVVCEKETLIECPPEIPHAVYNKFDEDVKLLVIKFLKE